MAAIRKINETELIHILGGILMTASDDDDLLRQPLYHPSKPESREPLDFRLLHDDPPDGREEQRPAV